MVLVFSLLGMTLPGAVTQFSMTVNNLANKLSVSSQLILFGDTIRATFLVISMFASSYAYNIFGLRKTILIGVLCHVIPQFLIPIAPSFWIYIVLKGVSGCNAIAFPLYISTIVKWVKNEQKGFSTAFFNGSFIAGSGVGGWVAGYIMPTKGWAMSYYAMGFLTLIFGIITLIITRDKNVNVNKQIINTKKSCRRSINSEIIRMPATWLMIIGLIASNWVNQAIVVDLPIFSNALGYDVGETGTMMMIISIVTVISSILGGVISDNFAKHAKNKLTSRCTILSLGYFIAIASSFFMPSMAKNNIIILTILSSLMMFGVSWAAGVFWSIPSEVYPKYLIVEGTAFCSGATTTPNPVAPFFVGIVMGGRGLWSLGWLSCGVISIISVIAILLTPKTQKLIEQRLIEKGI